VVKRPTAPVTKTIADLLAPRAIFPPRINVNRVYVVAVGVVLTSELVKPTGKSSSFKGNGKGPAKGKGKAVATKKLSIHLVEPESGNVMWAVWSGDNVAVGNLANAVVNVNNAKPALSREGVNLELDSFSSFTIRLNRYDTANDMLTHIPLATLKEIESMPSGTFVNVAMFLEAVQEKTTSTGQTYASLSIVDTAGVRLNFQVYDHPLSLFTQGDTILAMGVAVKSGRVYKDGIWLNDETWSQARYAGYRIAFASVGVLEQARSACCFVVVRAPNAKEGTCDMAVASVN
jgi:hypothetical protein